MSGIVAPATVAGRRYMTILFCDLVGSTELAEKFDPEDVQSIQQSYHDAALKVIESYGGFVASFAGDGILAYFGYPQARANDPERAVRAGLQTIAEVRQLDVTVGRRRLAPLATRIGIHTGLVVVGTERASGGEAGHTITGEAVNLAARLQYEAPGNGLVVSGDTLELVEGVFDSESLGKRRIKGISRLIPIHRIIGVKAVGDRLRRLSRRGATRMVGRTSDLERAVKRFERSIRSGRCVVLSIVGEAGVGKTRLALEVCQQPELAEASLIEVHCQELFANTPLQPVAGFLWTAAGLSLEDSDAAKSTKIRALLAPYEFDSPDKVAIVARLLGIKTDEPAPATPVLQKEQQFSFLVALVDAIAKAGIAILWIEDAHWLDPSSSELLRRIADELRETPLFILMTLRAFPSRPDLPPADEQLNLAQLGAGDCLALAKSVPGAGALTDADLGRAVAAAEGIPLFVEQLVLSLIDKGGEDPRKSTLPLSLAELMAERLDRVPSGRRVVQAAACIGRSCSASFLARVLGKEETEIQLTAEALVAAEILKPGTADAVRVFDFRHALLQRMAHESVTLMERRALHSSIADILMNTPDLGPSPPELAAYHLTEASRPAEAIQAWLGAGMAASQRFAQAEAIEHLRRGLSLLDQIADPALGRVLERALQAALIAPLTGTYGAISKELAACCARGVELCEQGEPTPLLFPFLFGQFVLAMGRGHPAEAMTFADSFISAADRAKFDSGLVIGHRLSGMAQLGVGDAVSAKAQLERSLALYDEERDAAATQIFGQNTQVHSRSLLSLSLLCIGDVESAITVGTQALRAADAIRHPHSTAIALGYFGGWVLGWLDAPDEMIVQARRLIALAEQHKLRHLRAYGIGFLGWALCQGGDVQQGAAALEEGVAELDALGNKMSIPGYYAQLADARRRQGRFDEARRLSDAARRVVDDGGDLWLAPEVLRIQALVMSDCDARNGDEPEEIIRGAVAKARSLKFPLFELRCLDTMNEILGGKLDAADTARMDALAAYRNLNRFTATGLRRRGLLQGR